jgi:hypothetical protein
VSRVKPFSEEQIWRWLQTDHGKKIKGKKYSDWSIPERNIWG